jgi:hypothetical protein
MNNDLLVINNRKLKITNKKKEYLIYQYCSTKGRKLPIAGNYSLCLAESANIQKLMNNDILVINNNKGIKKKKGYLINQYCSTKGRKLPCFCYNNNLTIAGNYSLCLAESADMPKLMLDCSTKITKNRVIKTVKTVMNCLQRVRKSIVEFLEVKHHLDYAVCDQGCGYDLKIIVSNPSLNRGRFYDLAKRSVKLLYGYL